NSHVMVVVFGIAITLAAVRLRYVQLASVLKWLALVLAAYVVTAFLARPNWGQVLRDAVVPSLPSGRGGWSTLVAILGTTISPYLFFWQASQEVEEERAMGRLMLIHRRGATKRELLDRRLDVGTGTFFSNLVMFFIILATALTLHAHGKTHVETSRQAAEALAPVAGRWASSLYTLGIFGVGFLAIPTLSGSAAYAFAETFNWREGLDRKPRRAWEFYSIVVLSTALGILLDFLRVNAMKILFGSAVINGLLAPFLLVAILILASDAKTMQNQPSPRLTRIVVGLTTLLMFAAAVGMFVFR
ncbi:MAG TPA: divalent metal cation transporter, partial [Thermoanaerobaculia bacterium]|nr:divalent metal cation transporter [Thermoanaerobaculia bacterium]